MNARLFIPASLALCAGIFTGCGGSSQNKEVSLPIGVKRNVIIELDNGTRYVFGFETTSPQYATVYNGVSAYSSAASVHVVNYVAADDRADQVSFNWVSNRDGEPTGFNAFVVMHNVSNVTRGTGSATCDVREPAMFIDPAQMARPGRLIDFQTGNN